MVETSAEAGDVQRPPALRQGRHGVLGVLAGHEDPAAVAVHREGAERAGAEELVGARRGDPADLHLLPGRDLVREPAVRVGDQPERRAVGPGQGARRALGVHRDHGVAPGGRDLVPEGHGGGELTCDGLLPDQLSLLGVDGEQLRALALGAGEDGLFAVAAAGVEVGEGDQLGQLGHGAVGQVDHGRERALLEALLVVDGLPGRVHHDGTVAGPGHTGLADPLVGVDARLGQGGRGVPRVGVGRVGDQDVQSGAVTVVGDDPVAGLLPAGGELGGVGDTVARCRSGRVGGAGQGRGRERGDEGQCQYGHARGREYSPAPAFRHPAVPSSWIFTSGAQGIPPGFICEGRVPATFPQAGDAEVISPP